MDIAAAANATGGSTVFHTLGIAAETASSAKQVIVLGTKRCRKQNCENSLGKEGNVDRLTKEEIERYRLDLREAVGDHFSSLDDPTREVHWAKIDALCDQSLSQESVRSEALTALCDLIAVLEGVHDSHKRKGLPLTDSQFAKLNKARSIVSTLQSPARVAEPVEWPQIGGIEGPENEPAALVAWISVAQKEGLDELLRRMQKRLLLWECKRLSPELYEKIKNWPIYTQGAAEEKDVHSTELRK